MLVPFENTLIVVSLLFLTDPFPERPLIQVSVLIQHVLVDGDVIHQSCIHLTINPIHDLRKLIEVIDRIDIEPARRIACAAIGADTIVINMFTGTCGITIATISADAMIKHMGFPTVHMIGIFKNAIRTSIDFIAVKDWILVHTDPLSPDMLRLPLLQEIRDLTREEPLLQLRVRTFERHRVTITNLRLLVDGTDAIHARMA